MENLLKALKVRQRNFSEGGFSGFLTEFKAVTFKELVDIFGMPTMYAPEDGDGKVQAEWIFKLAPGNYLTIYDYKEDDVPQFCTNWHVGGLGESIDIANELVEFINDKTK